MPLLAQEYTIYARQRDAAVNETLEIIEDLKEDGLFKPGSSPLACGIQQGRQETEERAVVTGRWFGGFARVLGVSSRYLAAMEVRDKQRNMCTTYHTFLDCAVAGIKAACSERAASFFHTSVVANFLERLLPERVSVEKIIGTVPAACEYLVQKTAYGLLPINSSRD